MAARSGMEARNDASQIICGLSDSWLAREIRDNNATLYKISRALVVGYPFDVKGQGYLIGYLAHWVGIENAIHIDAIETARNVVRVYDEGNRYFDPEDLITMINGKAYRED